MSVYLQRKLMFYNYSCYSYFLLASLHYWILSTFFHSHCNIMSGMYKGVGRWEGIRWVMEKGGHPEAGYIDYHTRSSAVSSTGDRNWHNIQGGSAWGGVLDPVKTLLQDLPRKGPFLAFLQDLARSCEILWDLARCCRNLLGILCKIPARFLQNPTRSRKVLQECQKKELFLEDLARAFLLGSDIIRTSKVPPGVYLRIYTCKGWTLDCGLD